MPENAPAACVGREPYSVLRDVWTVLMRDAGLAPETRRHMKVAYHAALDPRLEPKIRRAFGVPPQRSKP